MQGAVDAVPDPDACVLGLDVDVGGAVANALRDDEVHDLDDRCVDAGVRFGHRPRRDRLGRQEGVDMAADAGEGPVGLVDRAADVRRRSDHGDEGHARRLTHLLEGRLVLRERHRDLQTLVRAAHGDRHDGAGHRFGNQGDRVVVRGALPQVGHRKVQPGSQDARKVEVVDRPQLDQQLFELGRGDQLALDQELAEHRHPGNARLRRDLVGHGPTDPVRIVGFRRQGGCRRLGFFLADAQNDVPLRALLGVLSPMRGAGEGHPVGGRFPQRPICGGYPCAPSAPRATPYRLRPLTYLQVAKGLGPVGSPVLLVLSL